jgi:hypothetical protein
LRFTYSPLASDWIIALTDGEDNNSTMTGEALIRMLSNPIHNMANVIVIGIGGDVKAEVLASISRSTPKGVYIFANDDKTSIDQAFGEVISLIEGGQIIVED